MEDRPRVRKVDRGSRTCAPEDGSIYTVPDLLARFLNPGDRVAVPAEREQWISVARLNEHGRWVHFLYARASGWRHPRPSRKGGRVLHAAGTPALFLDADCLTSYFYSVGLRTLYQSLGVSPEATLADLRTAWRLRHLELVASNRNVGERLRAERSFNILMNPRLKACYDSMLLGEDAPLPIPYAGPAEILVEGSFSADEVTFFGKRIVSYRPETEKHKISILLRTCEFLENRVICRDPRRKLEVWLDRTQLPGIPWDLTWNHSKHWLQSRIEIEATCVRTSIPDGELRLVALPSRTQVFIPEGVNTDTARAAETQRLVGQNLDALNRIRSELHSEPTEYVVVQQWLDHLGIRDVGPEMAVWESDYDPMRAYSSSKIARYT